MSPSTDNGPVKLVNSAASGATADVIDASVVLCARRRQLSIGTSDPDDMRRLDPSAEIIVV